MSDLVGLVCSNKHFTPMYVMYTFLLFLEDCPEIPEQCPPVRAQVVSW